MGLIHRGREATRVSETFEGFAPSLLMRDASKTPSTSKMAAFSVRRYSDLSGRSWRMLMMLEVQIVALGT
jgi:hypothetical protein